MKLTNALSIALCIAFAVCSHSNAQEAETASENKNPVANTQDGVLNGKVFVDADGTETPINANVTLSSDGVVIDSVEADKNGAFAFQGIEPGSYQLLGSSDGYIGGQAYDVQPYVGAEGSSCSSCSLGLQSAEVPHETIYEAPAAACGSCSAAPACGSCGGGLGGGGGFGGGGGGLFGGGGGGIFGGRRLLALGAVGGIVAIATSDDDDDNDNIGSIDQ